jgi:predicted nucleic acid-binding protein
MVRPALVDSNILVDHFNGIQEADTEISYYDDVAISAITWMELMTGFEAKLAVNVMLLSDFNQARLFLDSFPIIYVDRTIMTEAAKVRCHSLARASKIALPDAIIRATANITGRLIVTRNTKDFTGLNVRVPYNLSLTNTSNATVLTPADAITYTVTAVAAPPD